MQARLPVPIRTAAQTAAVTALQGSQQLTKHAGTAERSASYTRQTRNEARYSEEALEGLSISDHCVSPCVSH